MDWQERRNTVRVVLNAFFVVVFQRFLLVLPLCGCEPANTCLLPFDLYFVCSVCVSSCFPPERRLKWVSFSIVFKPKQSAALATSDQTRKREKKSRKYSFFSSFLFISFFSAFVQRTQKTIDWKCSNFEAEQLEHNRGLLPFLYAHTHTCTHSVEVVKGKDSWRSWLSIRWKLTIKQTMMKERIWLYVWRGRCQCEPTM